jgi:hypothetical protein
MAESFARVVSMAEALHGLKVAARTRQEQHELNALLRAAFGLLDISGSWHPDDSLHHTAAAETLRRMMKTERL